MKRRAVMYDVGDGGAAFYTSVSLPDNVKDASAILYNTTIGMYESLNSQDLNIVTHGNTLISCFVERENGIIVKINPLITCLNEAVEERENGNVYYRDIDIIKLGKPGTNTEYIYAVPVFSRNNNTGYINFSSLEEALSYIDKNK